MAVPVIKTITEMRDSENIAQICNEQGKPVVITRNGQTYLVVISAALFEEYEAMRVRLELYDKLAEAEAEAKTGFKGYPLDDVMNELMADLDNE